MKKLLLFLVPVLLFACTDYTDDFNAIDERLDKLESTIPTIDEQISSIQTSIEALKAIDTELDDSIKALEASDKATAEEIAALKDADKAIEAKIAELKKYVDDALKATKDWVSATFATLEQLNALSGEVAALKSLVDANKAEAAANLANAISNLETSLKKWVGEQLSNYYTIAQIDAKIAELQKTITDGDSALQQQLNDLKSQLETTKSEVTEAYKKAIEEAINTNNGVIDTKIANEIATVNQRIDSEVATINAKIAELQAQVNQNTENIAKLLARIQSVSYVPTYEDGKATVKYLNKISQVTLDFEITPKDAVAELAKVWEDAVSLKAVYTQTRAVSFVDMPIVAFEADAENGVITVTASGENLSAEFFNGVQTASVRLAISDGNNSVTSEYASMIAAAATGISEFVVPINEIWYTSTDDTVVEPYKAEVFGANIVSNTYEDGQGIILFNLPITSIGAAAFSGCTSLTSVIIPNSVTSIGNSAFYRCLNLSSVTIPDSVISIGNYAFEHCKLASITIPNSVTSIGDVAFFRCNSLTSVTIPDSVTKIGEGVFSSCDKLEYFYGKFASNDNRCLIVGNTLNTYAAGSTLVSYTIPEHITIIGGNAFQHNDYITSITITEGVTKIGVLAFAHCGNLASVFCKPTTPPSIVVNPYTSGAFYGNASDRKIYVPRDSVSAYKSADGWSTYADYIEGYDF